MFKKVDPRQNFPLMEKNMLEFWKDNKVFEESMNHDGRPAFSFYDGPPFATGLPHYGHVVASLIKDVVPRYWTMKGKRVDRRWGWDCHGLPVENLIEKELGIANKQAIEDMGIDKFNEACCGSVLRYADEWKEFIPRIGRWVDMENDYRTMDWKFTESIWWVFSEIYKKGLVYESYKSMHMCPRCETTLANFEVTQGYKDITDLSATVKFKLIKESAEKILNTNTHPHPDPLPQGRGEDAEDVSHSERSDSEVKNPELTRDREVYVLAWTTTPWTLPGNVALAVGEEIEYCLVPLLKGRDGHGNPEYYYIILAKDAYYKIFNFKKSFSVRFYENWKVKFDDVLNDVDKIYSESENISDLDKVLYERLKNTKKENLLGLMEDIYEDNCKKWDLFVKLCDPFVHSMPEGTEAVKDVGSPLKFFKGSVLKDFFYEPVFDYYAKKEDLEKRENGWKIYAADFVTTEEGTGVVHIAPAFGEDDMNLAHEKGLPFVQHVSRNGKYVMDFIENLSEDDKKFFTDKESGEGLMVKPRKKSVDDKEPSRADVKMVEYLEKENVLFSSKKYPHSYPHCWRCDTPLLNYASSSWFVEVTKIKDRLVTNNQQVNWMPGYIKDGRFGKWLEDARDWAVSRSRFWGAALPIWRCEDCGEIEVIGSIDELREKTDTKITKFIFSRHGEAESNALGIISNKDNIYHLTVEGKKQAEGLAEKVKDAKIDVIISSPVLRALETAGIVAGVLGLPIEKNELAREINHGSWDGYTITQLQESNEIYKESIKLSRNGEERYNFKSGGDGESRADAEKRVREFIKECVAKYPGKNILVVSHGIMGAMLDKVLNNLDLKGFFVSETKIEYAKAMTFYATEEGKGFDLHKPYIDKIEFKCAKCGKSMKIVGDVFDCWFESGSMPYAQIHYPFENREKFDKSFPAKFIAEGIDQTRGWFYTLMVLSTALFDKPAFKNVIVNGIVLAEDGQKMSKKLKNYPDPNLLLEKYGADSLRYYLLTSPVMKAENLRFSEKGVDEVLKKFVLTLWNTYSFLVMNVELSKIETKDIIHFSKSENLLDKWILSELNLLISEVDREMQNYDLVKASRPLRDFVDKLSNWYLRRSRKRFTLDDLQDRLAAYQTLSYVLTTFSKVMAPFMPFLSDEIFRNLSDRKSVHLEKFPEVSIEDINDGLSVQMNLVRDVVTLGLAVRAQNRLKVRMPLATLFIQKEGIEALDGELVEILKEELNIKEVKIVSAIEAKEDWGLSPEGTIRVALDLTITEELELEGISREIIRQIQSMRKNAGYERDDVVSVRYEMSENAIKFQKMFEKFTEEIKAECLLSELFVEKEIMKENFDGIDELVFDGEKIILVVKK